MQVVDGSLATNSRNAEQRDFFISFNSMDRAWAEWIAWVLEDAEYSVYFQDWDFRGNFIEQMDHSHKCAVRTVAVLSENYFSSDMALAEWSARFSQDPAARQDRLVPVKVSTLPKDTFINPIIYADLTGCDEEEARKRLLNRIAKSVKPHFRTKPMESPSFPGKSSLGTSCRPEFPASLSTETMVIKLDGDSDLAALQSKLEAVLEVISRFGAKSVIIDTRRGSLIATLEVDEVAAALISAAKEGGFFEALTDVNATIISAAKVETLHPLNDLSIIRNLFVSFNKDDKVWGEWFRKACLCAQHNHPEWMKALVELAEIRSELAVNKLHVRTECSVEGNFALKTGGAAHGRPDDSGRQPYSLSRPVNLFNVSVPAADQFDVSVTVKWYNVNRGFGFVSPADGSPDAFLHISELERAGLSRVTEGDTLLVDLGSGNRGPQVMTVHELVSTTASPRVRNSMERGQAEIVEGVVKFFSAEKGFGFVTCDDGGKDVFVHIKALERSGLHSLEPQQRVRMVISEGRKHPEVESIYKSSK